MNTVYKCPISKGNLIQIHNTDKKICFVSFLGPDWEFYESDVNAHCVFAHCGEERSIFRLISREDLFADMPKGLRFFRLETDLSWTELYKVNDEYSTFKVLTCPVSGGRLIEEIRPIPVAARGKDGYSTWYSESAPSIKYMKPRRIRNIYQSLSDGKIFRLTDCNIWEEVVDLDGHFITLEENALIGDDSGLICPITNSRLLIEPLEWRIRYRSIMSERSYRILYAEANRNVRLVKYKELDRYSLIDNCARSRPETSSISCRHFKLKDDGTWQEVVQIRELNNIFVNIDTSEEVIQKAISLYQEQHKSKQD
jgi:hypothetical protein